MSLPCPRWSWSSWAAGSNKTLYDTQVHCTPHRLYTMHVHVGAITDIAICVKLISKTFSILSSLVASWRPGLASEAEDLVPG